MFMSASGVAGAIGGPLAGTVMSGLQGVNGWAGWRWVFLIEGMPSIIASIVTWFYLTDQPSQAKWLTQIQRQLVQADLARDGAALGRREKSLRRALKNGRLWLLILTFFCIVAARRPPRRPAAGGRRLPRGSLTRSCCTWTTISR